MNRRYFGEAKISILRRVQRNERRECRLHANALLTCRLLTNAVDNNNEHVFDGLDQRLYIN